VLELPHGFSTGMSSIHCGLFGDTATGPARDQIH
jgi:hypothetical protein